MNKILRSSLLGMLASGAVFLATPAGAQESNWEKFKTFAHTQKQEAIAEGKKVLAATDKQIESLKKDVKHSTAETKAAHEKNMAELTAKRKAAQAELARMEKAAAGTWDATKEGVSKAYRDMHEAVQRATASAKS